jgi:hypothetical protein
VLGLAPQPVPPFAVALDRERWQGALFSRERGAFALRETQAAPAPAGALDGGPLGGPVADAEALARAATAFVRRFARPPRAASLVLPDAWARGIVVELGELPARAELRAEVLRFRLRKLLPFRVEELRLAAVPIVPVAGQEDPVRALVLYAAEGVCAALERGFAAAGVRVGQIVGAALARLGALAHGGRLPGLVALAGVEPSGFTLIVARDGEPVLWRQKSFAVELTEGERAPLLAAELRLTRSFLAERLPGVALDGVVLAAPAALAPLWTGLLEEGLERAVTPLSAALLPLAGERGDLPAAELAALLGAAAREVA